MPPPPEGVTTIAQVVDRLTEICGACPPSDGVAVFAAMYRTVTIEVGQRVGVGFFADPDFMTALDLTFAGIFLAAVDADAARSPVPKAWAPLFDRRRAAGIEPVQFALAGMNAHINHDLAVAVVQTCRARGTSPGTGSIHADYLQINEVLAAVTGDVRRSFMDAFERSVDRRLAPVADVVDGWSIEKARDAAWTNARIVWRLGDSSLADDCLGVLARTVGMGTAHLLVRVV